MSLLNNKNIAERIEELQQLLESSRREYQKLKKELDLVQDGKLDDRLPEICKRIDE
jgi:predicted component of type VI protein secretion system